MPILPYAAVYLYDGVPDGFSTRFRVIPLKWSGALALGVYCRYWLLIPLVGGMLMAFFAFLRELQNAFQPPHPWTAICGPCLVCISSLCYYLVWLSGRRTRQIRKLLGRHTFGRSDPAMWAEELLAEVKAPQETYGTDSFAAAVPKLLDQGKPAAALWAARLTVALEDEATGERLTDSVLQHQNDHRPEPAPNA